MASSSVKVVDGVSVGVPFDVDKVVDVDTVED